MKKLSTGHDSTYESYIKLCRMLGFTNALVYFEEKAMSSPNGVKEEILADESQMMLLVARLEQKH